MIAAYHSIFSAYGFWLPNDPRGSWSKWVRSWELFVAGGRATTTATRRSLAQRPHDATLRQRAKEALLRPAMRFETQHRESVAAGFGTACVEAGYHVLACAIMPDHVHVVIRRHPRKVEIVVGHLKSKATMQLGLDGLPPDQPVWAKNAWHVYLDPPDLPRAIAYVNDNPLRAGLPAQKWPFVEPILG